MAGENQELPQNTEKPKTLAEYAQASDSAQKTFEEIQAVNRKILDRLADLQTPKGILWKESAIKSQEQADFILAKLKETKKRLVDNLKQATQDEGKGEVYKVHVETSLEEMKRDLNDVLTAKLDQWVADAKKPQKTEEFAQRLPKEAQSAMAKHASDLEEAMNTR